MKPVLGLSSARAGRSAVQTSKPAAGSKRESRMGVLREAMAYSVSNRRTARHSLARGNPKWGAVGAVGDRSKRPKIAKVATLPLIGLAILTPKSGNLELATLAMSGWQSWQPWE